MKFPRNICLMMIFKIAVFVMKTAVMKTCYLFFVFFQNTA